MPTWRTEWPRCLGLNPVFPRCSKTVFEAGPGLEAASSTQPADKQRAGITLAVGLGRLLGWEASEVTEGQARGTHQRRRPRGHRRQQQNELADEASSRTKFGCPPFSSPVLFCSVSANAGSSCSAACQDAHRAAPSCVTAPPSLFGGRPCSSWTWSAVSPNVRTGGRRPRCKGKLRLRGFVVCV